MHAKTPAFLAIIAAATLAALPAFAAGGDQQATPSFFVDATGGYSVYKSDLVQSNDTTTTIGYGFGVWAGAGHDLGMAFQREQTTVPFKLNKASISLAWQDEALRYRLGAFYAGLLVSSSTWIAKAPPTAGATPATVIDASASGYGAEFGVNVAALKKGSVHLEGSYVQAAPGKQNAADAPTPAPTATIGPRTDVDVGGSLNLFKNVDATCGFKYRTYKIIVDAQAHPELLNTTYVGLAAGWSF